jgi:hypothetical protein
MTKENREEETTVEHCILLDLMIKEDERGKACSTHGGEEAFI